MYLWDTRQCMGMQRRDHEWGQQPRTRMEQCQQPRHGKATAGLLFPRLAEFLLSYRGIGHRAPRAIKEERAASIMAPATPCCYSATQKHLTTSIARSSRP